MALGSLTAEFVPGWNLGGLVSHADGWQGAAEQQVKPPVLAVNSRLHMLGKHTYCDHEALTAYVCAEPLDQLCSTAQFSTVMLRITIKPHWQGSTQLATQ